jgi:hypothetical protein
MAESLRLVKAEKIQLQGNREFNEAWLQREIAKDPSMLGLGDNVYVAARELRQPQGGRLDLLLIDRESEVRYEVELMLGETDPSHIIRCIEYWDVERKRYPHHEHVAVLVAETVNSRFLNVIGLFNSVIPMIAIQLSALKIEDTISLGFAKVLDLARPGEAEEGAEAVPVGRKEWEEWSSPESMRLLDACFELCRESAPTAQPNFKSGYVGVTLGNTVDNFMLFAPRKTELRVWTHRLNNNVEWKRKLEEADIAVVQQRDDKLAFMLTAAKFEERKALLRDLVAEAHRGRWSAAND